MDIRELIIFRLYKYLFIFRKILIFRSPHDELRERLLETAIDMKENIPQRNTRNSSVGSQKSDCSETRKRRSTKVCVLISEHFKMEQGK